MTTPHHVSEDYKIRAHALELALQTLPAQNRVDVAQAITEAAREFAAYLGGTAK